MLVLVSSFASARANELNYVVSGVGDPLKTNILAHVENVQLGRDARLSQRDYDEVVADTERRARAALRPYGYYQPAVRARIERESDDLLRVSLQINPGPPMLIVAAQVEVRSKRSCVQPMAALLAFGSRRDSLAARLGSAEGAGH
jgi:hypothetical protein